MAYEVYLDDIRLPIPPEKIPISYPGQNKTANLINGEEINLVRPAGLAEISLDVVFPQMDYPAAVWDGSVDNAEDFLDHLQDLKESKTPFEFIVIRDGPGRFSSFDTNLDVTLEDYKVSDDVKEGLDLTVSISLKEYRNYGTKIMNFVLVEDQAGTVQAAEESGTERQGEPENAGSYTVVSGDSLWKIAKQLLGNGNRWQELYDLNRDKISNPNLIRPGQVLTIPS
ncbi:LysM peptidoglycan-binding domain-containing protein [Clostridium sp. AF18-27]|uniref:LysM peptidoglycan-binding domain-containing protein n=1 Tax=Enterocloster lavalensis TaxID=460384 RepID=UPI000E504288|nr:LysM peptidoglycan-binding domain-containing protein [Enterocloster lavalensis]RHR53376.1 LysM peptidoglycan-binding domain-containing protein [Clostridium sp. AF18-27]